MENLGISKIFSQIAELLELKGKNPFKIKAYQRAAQSIESLSKNINDLYDSGGLKALEEIPGVGKSIAEHIEELIKHGKITKYKELLKEFPPDFIKLLEIPGLGPKTAMLLHKKFKISSPAQLEAAIKNGILKDIPGFKEKKIENIKKGIELKKKAHGRFLISEATEYAEALLKELKDVEEIDDIMVAGSLRRGQETIGDIDILVISKKPEKIIDKFTKLTLVDRVLARGETKSSVIMKNGMQADLRVVPKKSFGAAAHYFTGSKGHNIHIRQLAQEKGWKINEYGIFDKKGKQIGGETEEDMFTKFGFDFIPPELREMRGEFETAKEGKLPKLIELKDIRGDLHMHTKTSDGSNTIEEMAVAAKKIGYEYIAITDHSVSTRVAGGLTSIEALAQIKEIKDAAKHIHGIHILAGVECDIKPDGSMDYKDEILKQFDFVIASVHSNFKMQKDKITERIIKAVNNPYVKVLGHPSGRLIGERAPYDVDMEEVLKACKKTGTAVEINSYPNRLDLTDIWCMRAKKLGVKMIISTDSHRTGHLHLMKYGVLVARRGWLEKQDILNTLPYEKFIKALK
ncbi:DNA polymerase/3'-5' exonuclease PolX [Candidatus Saganbacteria bacterium]|nr:DNA polymerase/3'-5' exonuclease PolX [Candidatus Saganbacteria bacterium]